MTRGDAEHRHAGLPAAAWVVVGLAVLESGWMIWDGGRALLRGDYATFQSGPYAGQLGPWAEVVSRVGIDPRSTAMKAAFVVYGGVWLAIVACYVRRVRGAWWAMLAAAGGSLWYVSFGTLSSLLQMALLLLSPVRKAR
jgi:hypothetical protein